jgi:hypothetical protein
MQITLAEAQAISRAEYDVTSARSPLEKELAMAVYKAVTEAAIRRLMK